MEEKENTIGIPKDTFIAGKDALSLLEDSSDLAVIIALERAQLLEALRQGDIDLALMPDAFGLEEEAKLGNLFSKWEYANSSAGSNRLTEKVKQEIQAQREQRIERCFGLNIKYPDILRTLVREEDVEMMWNRILGGMPLEVIGDNETAITQYPALLMFYFRKRLNRTLYDKKISPVEKDLLPMLREEDLSPNPVLAYMPFDWVRDGAQVREFSLIPIDEYIRPSSILDKPPDVGFRSFPGIWRKDNLSAQNKARVSKLVQELKTRLAEGSEIDERNAKEILWGKPKSFINKVLYGQE